MSGQLAGIIGSYIYREDDRPLYRRGNSVLIGIAFWNITLYAGGKIYYVWRNKQRAKLWDAMDEDERRNYVESHREEGNKRLDFRFAS